jgi:hypothetical protein
MIRPLGSTEHPIRVRPARLVILDVRREACRELIRRGA